MLFLWIATILLMQNLVHGRENEQSKEKRWEAANKPLIKWIASALPRNDGGVDFELDLESMSIDSDWFLVAAFSLKRHSK